MSFWGFSSFFSLPYSFPFSFGRKQRESTNCRHWWVVVEDGGWVAVCIPLIMLIIHVYISIFCGKIGPISASSLRSGLARDLYFQCPREPLNPLTLPPSYLPILCPPNPHHTQTALLISFYTQPEVGEIKHPGIQAQATWRKQHMYFLSLKCNRWLCQPGRRTWHILSFYVDRVLGSHCVARLPSSSGSSCLSLPRLELQACVPTPGLDLSLRGLYNLVFHRQPCKLCVSPAKVFYVLSLFRKWSLLLCPLSRHWYFWGACMNE